MMFKDTAINSQFVNESMLLVDDIDLTLAMLRSGGCLPSKIRVIQRAINCIQVCSEVIDQEALTYFSRMFGQWIDRRVELCEHAHESTLSILKDGSRKIRSWLQACQHGELPSETYFDSLLAQLQKTTMIEEACNDG